MTETIRSTPLTSAPDAALMFPTLTSAQIARIASHGVTRPVTRGEVLIEGGQTDVPFFVLQAGEIDVIRPSGLGDVLIAVLRPSQFTGDVSMILGRPAQMRLRVSKSGEVVQRPFPGGRCFARQLAAGPDSVEAELILALLGHVSVVLREQDAILHGPAERGTLHRLLLQTLRRDTRLRVDVRRNVQEERGQN